MKWPVKLSRRILFGVGLTVLILSGPLLVLPLIEKGRVMEASIEKQAVLLEQVQETVKKRPHLESKRKALKEEIRHFEALLIGGETPTLASARLQSVLEKILRQDGARIKRVKTFPAEVMVDYTRIAVQLTFTSDIRSFLNLLYDIENGEKLLSIVQMDVHFQDHQDRPQLRTIMKVEAAIKNNQSASSSAEEVRKIAGRKRLRERRS